MTRPQTPQNRPCQPRSPGQPRPSQIDPQGWQNATQRPPAWEYVSQRWAATEALPDKPEHTDEFISTEQVDHLDRCLADVPYLVADLEVAATKQDQFTHTRTPNGDGTESPLPYRSKAFDQQDRLSITIMGVAGLIWHRSSQGQPNPFRSSIDSALWLRQSLRLLAQDPDAEQYARRIAEEHDRVLDGPIARPPQWQYLGACPDCGADLAAEDGDDWVRCGCGHAESVAAVIEAVLATTEPMMFTDTQLVGALELDGMVVTRNQIKSWHRRGLLEGYEDTRPSTDHGPTRMVTRRLFKLGEVRRVAAEMSARRARSHIVVNRNGA